jgi:protein SCO1/2
MRSEPTAGSGGGAAPVNEATTDGSGAMPVDATPPVDRSAALAAGAPGIPRKFWYWALGLAAVLAVGGSLLEHVLSSNGLNPTTSATTTTAPAATATVPGVATSGSVPANVSKSSLASYMGLAILRPSRAPAIALTDQAGKPVTLSTFRGRVVVLTFFDGRCNDICAIEGAELRAADNQLGRQASNVAFVTVNTDPRDTTGSGLADAVTGSGLAATPNWSMVTGPLPSLNAVWRSYGVTVNFEPSTGLVAHNDVMYFVDQRGDLRFRATPFADESRSGTYSLAPADVARWAKGVAVYAEKTLAEGAHP